MMRSASRVRRVLLLALSIVQMGAPALAAVADATLASRASDLASRTHIEDHTRPGCAPVHPEDCALCQFLSLGGTPRHELPVPPVVVRATSCAQLRDGAGAPQTFLRAAAQPRAPPSLI